MMNRRILLAAIGLFFTYSLVATSGSLFSSRDKSRPSREYDVLHYKIEVSFEEEKKKVSGTTTISFVPLKSNLSACTLHAVELDVKSVVLKGRKNLQFVNSGKQLAISLDRAYGFSDTVTFSVSYSATPKKGMYFLSPDSTNPRRKAQIWTQGEDMDNRHWFPCWDFPNDRATSEVIATVRDSWSLLSNGRLVNVRHDKKNKTKTFHWSQSKPHVAYLVMIAAGQYEIVTEKFRNIPLEYYVYKERAEDGVRSLSATAGIMEYFENVTGFPYPWEKYAQIFIDDFMWGGMENTTAVTLNTSYLIDRRGLLDFTADDVVAHELAHQWFGDLVTCRDWSELWLNEGFANYYEALYKQHARGFDEFQLSLMEQAAGIISLEQREGRRPIVSVNSFPGNLYSKGAWVLYMLHHVLGQEEFHRAMRLYLQRNAFTSVGTCDLMKAVEDATGQNMDWFFDQWVFKAGYPRLEIASSYDEASGNLLLTIRQTQTIDSLAGLFRFPLDIECTVSSGKTLTRVWVEKYEQQVSIPLNEKPLMVIPDRGMKVLKELKFEKSKEELIYQLRNAADMADRILAARQLRPYPEDSDVFSALKDAALSDRFWAVRREAAIYLGVMTYPGVKEAMFHIYNDTKSAVRNAAIVALDKHASIDAVDFVKQALAADSSYIVQASCLNLLAEIDSANVFSIARQYVDIESHRDILRRAALQAFSSIQESASIPYAIKYVEPGNAPDIRGLALDILRNVGEGSSDARAAVILLASDFNSSMRKNAVRILGMWGGGDAMAVLQRRMEQESDDDVRLEIESALDEFRGSVKSE
ncbi:MAG: HEAT repeat domain-containing protein [Bacteroidetes bacterium]|nr:HEAT repeat domain-containing protein [Bacteroidota bacterium]MCW5896452.1 HEAT repeat domain-containing protein [Bacteroidota bacterium]